MKDAVIMVLTLCLEVCLWGFLYYRKKYFSLYQRVQEMQKDLLEGREINPGPGQEGGEDVIRDHLVRISKKYSKDTAAALEEKAALQGLISDFSHQLKTPLANIRLYQDLLKSPSLTDEKRRKLEKRLDEQTDKLDWILTSLFKMIDLERDIATLAEVSAPITDVIQRAVSAVLPWADQKNICFHKEDFPDTPLMYDPRWTEEVFINILENAVKYSPDDSCIRLSMECYETYGAVRIQDEGPGIPKEEYSRIFRKFYRGTTAEGKEGWGIGLYLARLILEKEQGYITVDAGADKGAVFSVFLPIMTKR